MYGSVPVDGNQVSDVVGVGFGPSNLALAVAIAEHNETAPPKTRLRAQFLERQPVFGWHRGMLLPDTTLQVSFLKDLVTLRNPRSSFGFVSYLHDRNRLVDFVNHQSFFPSRREYHDYLEWVAGRFTGSVHYGHEVVDVLPVNEGPDVVAFDVVAAHGGVGATRRVRTRNVVLAPGLEPVLPQGITPSDRVWHSSELLHRLDGVRELLPSRPRFVVVGAGQSAAEVMAHLHDAFPTATVRSVCSRYGFAPADDSPFVNQLFDPAGVDEFFEAALPARENLLRTHAGTNYSAVDGGLINELYRRSYQERVAGEPRLLFERLSRVVATEEGDDEVSVAVRSLADGRVTNRRCDVVVLATGYRPRDALRPLGELAALCKLDANGWPRVERDYRITTTETVRAGIYLQGGTEHSHGLSSTLLSNLAVRSGEITRALVSR
ncbi:L-lysine 6-monooxygenase [Actinoalloteichus sp. AHMU CJ021]|uniref:L-lysine N6-monooxygenase MbtG n=1 Tax=Actinoalloteichus caeruleus DSM 43889 TaxID=1120930 RepID=A0ABT1JC86_ACTCY|nr:SidA/IucD/PvdA family monooxygenase [Actinoalloteichus caeruleus]AUS80719.1 L-lysine 6-monooxygenase [Actinoalloteichus sp. AHMU CJ021]MCP2330112.1 L-ornithine N5-oxygenase [Actinoalloteichus caeruleus DSM 43889]